VSGVRAHGDFDLSGSERKHFETDLSTLTLPLLLPLPDGSAAAISTPLY
jgi:hypothetical protein